MGVISSVPAENALDILYRYDMITLAERKIPNHIFYIKKVISYIYIFASTASHSIDDIEDSENSQLQSSPEMYFLSFKETQDVVSIVGREIELTKDYTTGNATFKQGSRGTVIEATSRKDGKLKVKLDNDNIKTFRLIKKCDLQLYEGVPLSSNSESQTEEQSFEY